MTTNAQLLDQAMSRLGQRKSMRVRADVLTEINTSIDTLEKGNFHPWFLEKTATLDVSAGDTMANLPADFLIEADEVRPYYVLEGTTYYLTKRFYGTLLGEVPTSVKFYAIRGSEFHFRMVADIAYTILLPYYAQETGNLVDDDANVSNLWLLNAFDWVIGEALTTVAAVHLQNETLAAIHAARAQKAKRELFVYHEARVNKNQDFEVGGASDGS